MRFYFDIRLSVGGIAPDPEGLEFPDVASALREATTEANALIFDALRDDEPLLGRAIIVKDETGQVVDEIPICVAGLLI